MSNAPLYRLASNNRWFDGMRFTSLAAAKAKADSRPDVLIDVLAIVDNKVFRAVYSNNPNNPLNRGTYEL